MRLHLGNAATARLTTIVINREPLNSQFPMGPCARFELMFDMPRDPGANIRLDLRGDAGEEDYPFIAIASEGEPVASRFEPPRLPPNPLLPAEIVLESERRCDSWSGEAARNPFGSTA